MKPTLTIGIPAYNEEKNIGSLIRAILAEPIVTAQLKEIIVVSDASIDRTDAIVREIKDRRVRLIRNETRRGNGGSQEAIMAETKTDILVLLDADILPVPGSIDLLIAPLIADKHIGLVSGRIIPAGPRTFVERVLAEMHLFKNRLFLSLPRQNVYLCFGPARAFSKEFYSVFTYIDNCPTDALSYFAVLKAGLGFAYAHEARFIFRCPSTLGDHAKQSLRFAASRQSLEQIFGKAEVDEAYRLPLKTLLPALAQELLIHPVLLVSYAAMNQAIRWRYEPSRYSSRWEMAATSKQL